MLTIIIFLFGLIWGSFLNVLAYRLIREESLGGRSKCPHCNHQISWYDNVPVISWILLGGKCRTCQQPISALYPFIELLTAVLFVLLFKSPFVPSTLIELGRTSLSLDFSSVRPCLSAEASCEGWKLVEGLCEALKNPDLYCYKYIYFPAYFLFFSSLIVIIRTDLEYMLISRYTTLFLVPVGIGFAAFGFLPISPLESALSALGGYLLFYIIAKTFYWITGREGIGQGDLDLIAFIGAFTGLMGLWMTILIGSITGCIVTIIYLISTGKERSTQIPFGPFLALGAICYVLFGEWVMQVLV